MESSIKSKSVAFLGATLLAAGTSIGAGMLALPVLTGLVGFWPACLIFTLSWILITYTSFLFLEVNLKMEYEANLISMAKQTLGPIGKYVTFATYIFLFYSVSIAYLSGSGSIINDLLSVIFNFHFPRWVGIAVSLSLFGPSVYFGTKTVANLNILLVLGIVISYTLLLATGSSMVSNSQLKLQDWPMIWMGIPVIITSFTFQNVLPSLTTYLKRDVKLLKGVIVLGGLIPLIIYILWEWFVLGIVPAYGTVSIHSLLLKGLPASHALKSALKSSSVITFSQIFAFCAIVTSFLGVILSLFDFLADGFKIKKDRRGKLILISLIFIPPFIFAILFPKIFLAALNYAGSFGCVTLFMILPALMAWKCRYELKLKGPLKVFGGKPLLILIILIGLSIFVIQFFLMFGVLKTT